MSRRAASGSAGFIGTGSPIGGSGRSASSAQHGPNVVAATDAHQYRAGAPAPGGNLRLDVLEAVRDGLCDLARSRIEGRRCGDHRRSGSGPVAVAWIRADRRSTRRAGRCALAAWASCRSTESRSPLKSLITMTSVPGRASRCVRGNASPRPSPVRSPFVTFSIPARVRMSASAPRHPP